MPQIDKKQKLPNSFNLTVVTTLTTKPNPKQKDSLT